MVCYLALAHLLTYLGHEGSMNLTTEFTLFVVVAVLVFATRIFPLHVLDNFVEGCFRVFPFRLTNVLTAIHFRLVLRAHGLSI